MTKKILAAAFALWAASGPVFADETEDYEKWKDGHKENVKVVRGIKFQVPEDYPIKQYEGYVAPIPFEEYAYMKFEKTWQRIDALEKRVLELETAEAERKSAVPAAVPPLETAAPPQAV